MTRTFRVALLTSTLLAGQAMAETTLTEALLHKSHEGFIS